MEEARVILSRLLAVQAQEQKEVEEQVAEEARHLQNFQADCQRLIDDSKESEIIIYNAEQVITTAQVAIAKAQALIEVNKRNLLSPKRS